MSKCISIVDRLTHLRRYLQGWAGFFALTAQLKLFDKFDYWIRRPTPTSLPSRKESPRPVAHVEKHRHRSRPSGSS